MSYIAVIYDSKYGSSKQYATWIAQSLNADLMMKKQVNLHLLSKYEIIVYGGGIYDNKLSGINLLTENIYYLKEKPVAIFACGLSEHCIDNVKEIESISKEVDMLKLFSFKGAMDFEKLDFIDKIKMKFIYKKLSKKESLNDEEKALLETHNTSTNLIDKNSINELVSYVESKKSFVEEKVNVKQNV